ncbi:MAG: RNA polymerase-binding protein DksA [Piscinibacter sp.]|uniref:RNA polymerase-binding protein DksA n=1 Tax=Piscinibacter sp. TaxID=1903157 RepID=UPI003D11FD51
MSKTPATKTSTKKAAAKPAAPAAKAKPAAKAAPAKKTPAAKAPAKTVAAKAPTSKAPAAKPVAPAKTVAAKAPATPAPAPVAVAPVSAAPAPVKASRSSKAAPPAPVAAPLPPATSRFADRFAPPRPPTRQMNNLGLDTPKPAHKADPKLANAWKTKAGRDLTEAELMAMPESEYMNDKQLDFFRYKLQTLKDDLLSNAGETTEHLREDTSIVPDPADRATIEEEHALELRTRDRERKLLKKISQSLARIDAGDYGFCDETGEPIGLGRLIARPTATLSLEAQQRRELKQKMFGD